MASADTHHQRQKSLLSTYMAVGPVVNDEELDANDLEVAMINESFGPDFPFPEEQMKHSILFADPSLKSVFYGSLDADNAHQTKIASKKQSPDLGIEEEGTDFKMEVTPPPLHILPNITPSDKDELDRGQQLDKELERMMLEADEEEQPFSDSPLTIMGSRLLDVVVPICDAALPTFLPENIFASFDSQLALDDQQDSSECADAAEQIAYDVVSSLFADEHKNSSVDPFSEDEEEEIMVISASILQILQDDDIISENENELLNEDTKKDDIDGECGFDAEKDSCKMSLRNDSLVTIPSPTLDEQTVPVIDSWEQLGDSPIVAEKVYSEAKAVLKKIRAERKATQL